MTEFELSARSGLPAPLTEMLNAFPREEWEAHPHFAGLVAFWLDRHVMFRRLCATLRDDVRAAAQHQMEREQLHPRLARFGGLLVQQLHGHHQIEDLHYFPKLMKREAALTRGFAILDRDHHAMDGLLDGFARGAKGVIEDAELGPFAEALDSFDALLLRHLEDEEDLVVPVILKHGPGGLG